MTEPSAYAQAPPIVREISNVLALTRKLTRPTGRTPDAVREQLVRKAAVLDRIALQEAAEYAPAVAAKAIETATDTARKLVQADTADGTTTGPIPASSPTWGSDPRAYVRQEYAAWCRSHR
ncbi:hypothetical protein ACIO6U_28175 [Streptomyces sp. NPDC087422]|uniref:hypothetical protein n=1 Tax=Streptomyces sp. NPDC087422 TaxID=3365786 RepID=UPI0037F9B9AE